MTRDGSGRAISGLRKLVGGLAIFNKYLIATLLAAMTIVVVVSITMRYVFNSAPSWSEEVTKYLFIYLIFLAAAQGVRYRVHVRIDTLERALKGTALTVVQTVSRLLLFVLLLAIAYYGFEIVGSTMRQASPALGIPMGLVYLALPVGAILSMVFMAFPDTSEKTTEELSV